MKLLKLLVLSTALALSILTISAGPAFAVDPPEPDSIVVLARHTQAKPDDPVKVQFTSFKVTKATFDPKKIEGGKATIEIDATSLKTGADKRDILSALRSGSPEAAVLPAARLTRLPQARWLADRAAAGDA